MQTPVRVATEPTPPPRPRPQPGEYAALQPIDMPRPPPDALPLPLNAIVLGCETELGRLVVRELARRPIYTRVFALCEAPLALGPELKLAAGDAAKIVPVAAPHDAVEEAVGRVVTRAPRLVAFCCLGVTKGQAGSPREYHRLNYELPLRFVSSVLEGEILRVSVLSCKDADCESRSEAAMVRGAMQEAMEMLWEDDYYVQLFMEKGLNPGIAFFQAPLMLNEGLRVKGEHRKHVGDAHFSRKDLAKQRAALRFGLGSNFALRTRDVAKAMVHEARDYLAMVPSFDPGLQTSLEQLRRVDVEPEEIEMLAQDGHEEDEKNLVLSNEQRILRRMEGRMASYDYRGAASFDRAVVGRGYGRGYPRPVGFALGPPPRGPPGGGGVMSRLGRMDQDEAMAARMTMPPAPHPLSGRHFGGPGPLGGPHFDGSHPLGGHQFGGPGPLGGHHFDGSHPFGGRQFGGPPQVSPGRRPQPWVGGRPTGPFENAQYPRLLRDPEFEPGGGGYRQVLRRVHGGLGSSVPPGFPMGPPGGGGGGAEYGYYGAADGVRAGFHAGGPGYSSPHLLETRRMRGMQAHPEHEMNVDPRLSGGARYGQVWGQYQPPAPASKAEQGYYDERLDDVPSESVGSADRPMTSGEALQLAVSRQQLGDSPPARARGVFDEDGRRYSRTADRERRRPLRAAASMYSDASSDGDDSGAGGAAGGERRGDGAWRVGRSHTRWDGAHAGARRSFNGGNDAADALRERLWGLAARVLGPPPRGRTRDDPVVAI